MPINWGEFPMEYASPSTAQGDDVPETVGDPLMSVIVIQKRHMVSKFRVSTTVRWKLVLLIMNH